jgi:AraC family transcriptional regulator
MSHLIPSAGERFGTVLRTRRVGDFVFRLSRYPAGLAVPAHHHPLAYFSLVVDGRLRERQGRTQTEFPTRSVHFHGSQEPHDGRTGPEGLVCLSIVPQGELARRATAARPRPHAALSALAADCYRAFREDDEPSALGLEGSALELLSALLRTASSGHPAPAPGWIGAVREHLARHHARGVTLAELAALAGVHRVHLVRGFRRHVGSTPGAYQRRLRLEHARRALEASSQPIADIAFECGFASQSHLTRWFHREWGVPPQAYRRALRRRHA